MSGRSRSGTGRLLRGAGLGSLNRWTYATVLAGALFAAVQVVHIYQMLEFGVVGVVLEGVVPLLFAAGIVASGPWLHHRGYSPAEQRRIVVWMVGVAAVTGLLFVWALSHQSVVAGEYFSGGGYASGSGYGSAGGTAPGVLFPHREFVTATNVTAGALLGLLLGVYNVRSRRHYRTVQRERERVASQRARLSVLNRVLRHNLRNDANVILGNAREIANRADGEVADRAGSAAEKTAELVELGEKAREIDETLDGAGERADEVDLRSVLESVLAAHRQRGDLTFEVEAPVEAVVTTDERVLRRVLEELVENAVEHAPGSVRVRLTVERTADGVEVVVADDGPGLPRYERESIEAGEETALEHLSGLGLWLVRWGTAALGGEVSFEDNEWGGTSVRVRLPATPEADEPAAQPVGAPEDVAVPSPDRVASSPR